MKFQTPTAAREFYSRKVEELGKNLLDLEKIVQGKQGNLSVVEDGECALVTCLAWGLRGGNVVAKWLTGIVGSVTAESD